MANIALKKAIPRRGIEQGWITIPASIARHLAREKSQIHIRLGGTSVKVRYSGYDHKLLYVNKPWMSRHNLKVGSIVHLNWNSKREILSVSLPATADDRFSKMVRRVGQDFYRSHLHAVRKAVAAHAVSNLVREISNANGESRKTIRFRIEAMASSVRQGYDLQASNRKRRPKRSRLDKKAGPNYWIELYWPLSRHRKRNDRYFMWIDKSKLGRHQKKIRAGDIVFFYETQWKAKNRSVQGAMKLFAAATVTNKLLPIPEEFRRVEHKLWDKWRRTKLFAWVSPEDGLPRPAMNRFLGKGKNKKFTLRRGPFEIKKPAHGERLLKWLQRHDLKSSKPHVPGPEAPRKSHKKPISKNFRNLGLKSELQFLKKLYRKRSIIHQRHNELTNAFKDFCENELHILPLEKRFDVLLEYGSGNRLLIEAKSEYRGGPGRHQIREAIGQLFDYRDLYWPDSPKDTALAVLLPGKPEPQLLNLLSKSLKIHVLWKSGRVFTGTPGAKRILRAIKASKQ